MFTRASSKAPAIIRASSSLKRDCIVGYFFPVDNRPVTSSSPSNSSAFAKPLHYITPACWQQSHGALRPFMEAHVSSPFGFPVLQKRDMLHHNGFLRKGLHLRYKSNLSIELKPDGDAVRFSLNNNKQCHENRLPTPAKKANKRVKISKKAKRNELRFYRLKAKKKMNSPNPEVRIRYKLEKAKRKEVWLIEKLRKFELPKAPAETYDPEILTEEERHYLKRTGEKKKNYAQVGRRGVFGGVVLNMHLHWKKHETVKVVCKPCQPGKIHEYAEELARLSKGIVIDIKPDNTIIFYRGKNYVRPKDLSPSNTLSKHKALEKYKHEQSLEHTGWFIEKSEKELEEYQEHVARYKKQKVDVQHDSLDKLDES